MALEIERATPDQRGTIDQLMQLYIYDFSEFIELDVARDGLFAHEPLSEYWDAPGGSVYLIYVDDRIAGFVLVSQDPFMEYEEPVTCIGEFFILRRYRRKGYGRLVAFHLFNSTPRTMGSLRDGDEYLGADVLADGHQRVYGREL